MVIGDGNALEACSAIGTPAEAKGKESLGTVVIGNRNKINEFVTIHSAVESEEATFIGDNCYIMAKSHIGHDSLIESDVTLSCLSIIGGHSVVMRGANIGLSAVIHQRRVIGNYCMVGMNSTVTRSLPPFLTYIGSPAKHSGVNTIGLQRSGMSDAIIGKIRNHFIDRSYPPKNLTKFPGGFIKEQLERFAKRLVEVGDK